MDLNANTKIEQLEMDGIDSILHILWKEKLLTDFDHRRIASNNTLMGKKAAVYTAIMSKSKGKAAILTKSFRKITKTIRSREKSISLQNDGGSKNEGSNFVELPQKNPFLILPIIECLQGFLPLEDIKRSRLVCREWKFAAEICLRKRSSIHFQLDVLTPHTFMEATKYSLPFPSFVFSNDEDEKDSNWQISKFEDFFEVYGKNIKELTFKFVTLTTTCNLTDRELLLSYYDLTPRFINPSNITSLIIMSSFYEGNEITTFDISLENFVSLKTLSLKDCRLIVSAENQNARIAPISVHFDSVLIIQNGNTATHLRYNDLIDCSKALNISLHDFMTMTTGPIFDMGKQILNLKQLHLSQVELENWSLAKGEVEFLYLNYVYFLETNHLKIKQLQAHESKIDLSALPETLEILICKTNIEFSGSGEIYLPNLKYLYIPGESIDSLAYFSNCTLVELQIQSCPHTLNLSLIPKSVKKLKMRVTKLQFTDDSILELDTLILVDWYDNLGWKKCVEITAQIQAKVLVIDFKSGWDIVMPILVFNLPSEKIIIGLSSDVHEKTSFEGSILSKYVDKKSNYYQFENRFGKSITKAQFQEFTKMNCDCVSDFFNQKYL